MDGKWLVLSFHLPPEPSRPRVAVWRRLQKLGAIKLEGGVWLLPNTENLEDSLRELAREVRRHHGAAHVFSAYEVNPDEERELSERYNRAREGEYAEVLRECNKLLVHIEREAQEQNYMFTEVEELEEDLGKIERWFAQVKERDVFGVPARHAVEEMLQVSREALDTFTRKVFQRGVEGEE